MSWRIATDISANLDGAANFTICVDGTIEQCLEKFLWEEPIKVWFTDTNALRAFLKAWREHRDVSDIWAFYHPVDGEMKKVGPDHPTLEELLTEIELLEAAK